ncbi:MAG: methyltransferase domain-containing protein [Alphaproteobacteria bacterium]|nr:methyltransferase domain-containing protein [Alphaproteobacteria bacterium]
MALAPLIKRSLTLACAYYLFDDWRAGRRIRAGRIETESGRRHAGLSLDASIAYVERVHRDYLAYSGLDRLCGTIAEIGPGDSFGVALLLLGGGATAVHAIDRFRPRRDATAERALHAALAERHGLTQLLAPDAGAGALRGLTYHPGTPAETFFRDRGLRFDAVVSRAVLEHLYDPLTALDDMLRALLPGGCLIHRIDLRDHGMFAGLHPLTFLTVAPALYRRMTRHSNRPNRVLLPAYAEWLASRGASGSLRITRLVGQREEYPALPWDALPKLRRERALLTVRHIRPRLATPFDRMADADLAVSGCVLVAEQAR